MRKRITRRRALVLAAGIVAAPHVARAQFFNPPMFMPQPANATLLDALSATSFVAYSTRLLRTAYAGKALRVQRSSDNTQQDIGFVAGNLDTASLLSFVGAGNGTIGKWYDQSGNGNDATNLPPGTVQPAIVSSGSLITFASSGRATISYSILSGAGNPMQTPVVTTNQPDTIALVAQYSNLGSSSHLTDGNLGGSNRQLIGITGGGTTYQLYAGNIQTGGTTDTNPHGIVGIFNGASGFLYIDNSAVISSGAGTGPFDNQLIGAGNGPNGSACTIPEYIGFTSAISSGDRTIIEASWHGYWGTP